MWVVPSSSIGIGSNVCVPTVTVNVPFLMIVSFTESLTTTSIFTSPTVSFTTVTPVVVGRFSTMYTVEALSLLIVVVPS